MADDAKAVEALYNLTKAAYDAEISRYDATEAKAGRYLTVLGLVIGAFVIKFDDVLWVWDSAPVARWVAVLFVLAYATTVSCALVAFGSSIVAMSVKDVSAIPVGEEMEQLFAKHDYKDALEATTESFRTGHSEAPRDDGRSGQACSPHEQVPESHADCGSCQLAGLLSH